MSGFMFKRFLIISVAAVGMVTAVIYMAVGERLAEAKSPSNTVKIDQVALGQKIYASRCAACHGVNLEGQANWKVRGRNGRLPAPPHDASGHTWHHDDETLFQLTKFGFSAIIGEPVETNMPVFDGKLTDEEIWASLAYIKSRWPQKIQQRQADMIKRAGGS